MAVSTATEKLILRMGPSASRPVMDVGEPFYDTDTQTFGVGNGTPNPPLALSSTGKQVLTNKTWVDPLPTSSFASVSNTYSITIDNPYLTANRDGMIVTFVANSANNGPAKLAVNTFGSVDLVDNKGQPLASGAIVADQIVQAQFKNGVYRALNLGTGGTSNVSSTGTSSNTFSIGDGSNSVKKLIANTAAATKPFVQYNDSTQTWEFSNDGINANAFGSQVLGGMFDTSLDGVVFYTATTSTAPAWTAPSTTGHRYVIRSILATNTGSSDADVTAEVSYASGGGSIAYAWNITVPVGGAVELLRKAKVFQPGDVLTCKASLAATVQIMVVYADISDTAVYGIGVDLPTANMTDLRIANNAKPDVVESILLANDDGSNPVDVTVVITDSGNVVKGYFVSNFTVDPKSTIEILDQPKFLPAGWKLRAQASVANRAEITVTGRAIS